VLVQPEAAGSANKDNVVVGEPRNSKDKDKVLAREIVLSRKPDGKETIKISINYPALGGATGTAEVTAKVHQAKKSRSWAKVHQAKKSRSWQMEDK
jgi:hypothetical protein